MAEEKTLKQSNGLMLASFVAAHALVVGWLAIGHPMSKEQLISAGVSEWSKCGIALVVVLVVGLLNRLGDSDFKARLVFWRFRNPLPGSRAFSEHATNDPRIHVERLRAALGGAFPTAPKEQNQAWYRLLKKHGDQQSVADGHREYLLFRDMAWLSLLQTLVVPALLWFTTHSRRIAVTDALVFLSLYLLAKVAAVMAGNRLVRTVLACASADGEPAPSPIIIV